MNILLKKYFVGLVGVVCLSITGLSYASTVDELISHIRQGNDKAALEIINNNDKCIHTANAEEKTALIVASRLGKEQLAQALIEKQALIDHQDLGRMTALHWAIDSGHTNIALMLIEAGANIELLTRDNQNALIISAKKQNSAVMQALVHRSAKLDQQTLDGNTALHRAIDLYGFNGKKSNCALQLLEAGANTELAATANMKTPLELAIEIGNTDIVQKCIACGANIDRESKRDGHTPLQRALDEKQLEIARLLIDNGASLQPQYGPDPFKSACRGGQAEVVKGMLRSDRLTPDQRAFCIPLLDKLGLKCEDVALPAEVITPLRAAAASGDTNALQKLLANRVTAVEQHIRNWGFGFMVSGVDLNLDENNGSGTALHTALNNGQAQATIMLLEAGANPGLQDAFGRTPLMIAAQKGHLDVLRKLLDQEVDPNTQDKNSKTALDYALQNRQREAAKMLMSVGAKTKAALEAPERGDGSGPNEQGCADKIAPDDNTQHQQRKATKMLRVVSTKASTALKKYTNNILLFIEAIGSEDNETAIHLIRNAITGKEVFNLHLADRRTQRVQQTITGATALIAATVYERERVVRLLIEKKVDLDQQDDGGLTALIWALHRGNDKIARMLIEAGANTMTPINLGVTPLMIAAEIGNKSMVGLLLTRGTNTNQQDNNGRTALMWAIQEGRKEIALVLTDAGTDVNLPDNNGRSPLMVAAKAGMLEVVERLLEKGARPKYEIEGNTARDLVCKLRKSKTYPHKKRLFQRIEALLKAWENKQDEQTEPARVNRIVNTDEKSAKHSEHELRIEHTTSGIAPEHSSPKKEPESTETPAIHALLDDINALAKLLREKPYTLAENGRPLFIDIIIKSIGTKGSAQRYRDILEKLIFRTQLLDLLLPTLATTSKSDGGLNLFHAIALLNGNAPHVRALFDSLKAIIIIKDPETNESYVSKEVRAALNQPDNNGRRPLEIATNEQTRAYLCTLGASDTSPLGHPTEAISNDDDEKQDEVNDKADNAQDPQGLFEGLLQAVRGNKGKEIRSLTKWMIAQGLKPMISRQMAGGNTLLHIAVEMNNLEAVKALTGRYDISILPQARKTTKVKKKRKKKKKQAMDNGLTMQFGFSARNNDGLTALALAQKALQETAQHSPEHAIREAIVRHLASNSAAHQGTLPEEFRKSTFSDSVSQFHAAVQVGNVQRVRDLLSQESSLILSTDPEKGTTALQTAAQRNRTEIMGLLLARGARNEESIRNFTHKETTPQGRLNTDQLVQLDQAFDNVVESFRQKNNTWKQLYDHVQKRHLSAMQGGNTDTNSGRFYDRLLGSNPAKSLLGLITAAREAMLTNSDCVQYRKGTHLRSDFVLLADHEVGLHEAWIIPVCAHGIRANVVAAVRNGKMKITTVYPAA